MNNQEIIKKILELDLKYSQNDGNGIKKSKDNYIIISKCYPIMFSAPHAVKQYRKGKEKIEDSYTGAIVEFLCEKFDVNGIVRTYNLNDDPNNENNGYGLKYKEAIISHIKNNQIKIFFDIHICSDKHNFEIEIGTNNGNNTNERNDYLEIIKTNFSKLGNVVVDEYFKASNDTRICNYIHKMTNIPCFQIEISNSIRKNKVAELIKTLEIIIKQIKPIIIKER